MDGQAEERMDAWTVEWLDGRMGRLFFIIYLISNRSTMFP
jgi:hypothetical protein